MPLSDQQKHLLHEIFDIPYESVGVIVGEGGFAVASALINPIQSTTQRLLAAIVSIDSDETKVTRVGLILAEYESLSLDPSKIERNGYSLNPAKSVRLLRQRLYPYTGLSSGGLGRDNQLRLG